MAVKKIVSEPVEPIQSTSVSQVSVSPPVAPTPPPMSSSSTQAVVKLGFVEKVKALLFHPFQFTEYMQREQGYSQALIMWVEVSILFYTISAIFSALIYRSAASVFNLALSLFLYPIVIIFISVPTVLLIGLLLHGCLKLFKGRGNYGDTIRAILYAGIPGSLITILITVLTNSSPLSIEHPATLILIIIGSIGVYVYNVVIQAWFLSAVHQISKMAAFGASVLMSFIVFTFVFVSAFLFAGVAISIMTALSLGGDVSNQADYMNTINQIDTQRLDASARLSNLESKSPTDGWTTDEKQQFQQVLLTLGGLHAVLNTAKVPDNYSAVNSQFLEALSGYQAANEQFRVALAANDEPAMLVAIETFARADELYVHAHQTFEALVEDSKSGASMGQNDLQGTLRQGFSGGFMQGLSGGAKAY